MVHAIAEKCSEYTSTDRKYCTSSTPSDRTLSYYICGKAAPVDFRLDALLLP